MYNCVHHFSILFLVLLYLDPYGWVLKLGIEKLEIVTMWSLFLFVFLSRMCVEWGWKVPAEYSSRADAVWMGGCIAMWLQTRNFPANWKLLMWEGDVMVRKGDLGSTARKHSAGFLPLPWGILDWFLFLCSLQCKGWWTAVQFSTDGNGRAWNLELAKLGEKWCLDDFRQCGEMVTTCGLTSNW